MKKKRILGSAVAFGVALSMVGMPHSSAAGANDSRLDPAEESGVQLNRMQRYLEEQAIRQRIEEGRHATQVDVGDVQKDEKAPTLKFVLKKINTTPSVVLSEEELAAIGEEYIGKEVSLADLYQVTADVNALYVKKGYMTCKAFLGPQRVHDGQVLISLAEGRTDKVKLQGTKDTRPEYITHRLHLAKGEVKNTNELNEELMRFNAMNDVQLRIALRPGAEADQTDYELTAYEPQTMVTGVFADNAGSKTSGSNRAGVYWLNRSLTGNRDNLFLSMQRSEGTKVVSASYTTPINRSGTKLGVTYNTNSVHITDGDLKDFDVNGHAYSYTMFLTQPMQTTEKVKSQWGVEIGRQHSVTDVHKLHANWVDGTVKSAQVYVDQINYGRSTVLYQKHAYRFGDYTDKLNDKNSKNFGKYTGNLLFMKNFAHGQNWTLKLDGQIGGNAYLPSSERYYIGGIYSVRGYKESLLGGDSGLTWSVEYALPVEHGGTKNVMGYAFVEGGSVYGDSGFDDHTLASVGVGVRMNLGKRMTANVGVGLPLIRKLNEEEQERSRFHFSLNGQF